MRIRGALEAVKDRTYGTCRSCGKPVGEARLKAMPEAPLCVNCSL
ncbi:MAG: hypothetical protein COX65_00745 [Elusimicrobia bacterium CG_4_10_14_0_2_um_filter_56_8]|nr:MAG: hypothetical protein COX65_00745 [Elusimicrobia bacterium CG_4_10_14_0_2_um_filter_56_8]